MTKRIRNTQWISLVILILLITGCNTLAPVKISIDTNLIPKEAALNYLKSITVTSRSGCHFSDKTINYLLKTSSGKSELKYTDASYVVSKSTSGGGFLFFIFPNNSSDSDLLYAPYDYYIKGCQLQPPADDQATVDKIATALHSLGSTYESVVL